MATQTGNTTKGNMTFTIEEVRTYSSGDTNSRKWTKCLIFTEGGDALGTFDCDWKVFEGDTVSAEVTEKLFGGKPYLSIGKPPSASPTPSKPKKAAPEPFPSIHPDAALPGGEI